MAGNQLSEFERRITAHYGKAGLAEAILNGLKQLGVDPDAPTIEDLAPVDEFHTAGRITTLNALEMMPLSPGMHVLDAGCGIGGTARCLAHQSGCKVTGLDLTPEYIAVSKLLTERVGLSEQCAFQHGSVLNMPFVDASFDAGVSFHVAMNIEDRPKLYSEFARVLRPGAPICVFDVMKGPAPGMHFPVPWAETETISFLRSRDETVAHLQESGFQISAENNLRAFAMNFFRDVFAKIAQAGGPPPVGLHLLTGANSPEKFANYLKALEAHQIEPVMIVAVKR